MFGEWFIAVYESTLTSINRTLHINSIIFTMHSNFLYINCNVSTGTHCNLHCVCSLVSMLYISVVIEYGCHADA